MPPERKPSTRPGRRTRIGAARSCSALVCPMLACLALACLALTGPAVAADADKADLLDDHPGFFDLDSLGLFSRDELNVHISVKGPLLALVASAAREGDPELADALGALRGIEVRVYEVGEGKRSKIQGLLEESASELTRGGWQTAITIRVDRDHGYALLRFAEEPPAGSSTDPNRPGEGSGAPPDPVGLVAMYLTESNEAVFVNIVGTIDTATVGRLSRRFDLDLLAIDEP